MAGPTAGGNRVRSITKVRVVALLTALVLVLAACGSRSDDDTAANDDEPSTEDGGDGGSATGAGDTPCGEGDASGATDTGVTDDAISIGTIQDVGGQLRPDLMIGPRQAMEAFVAYCNSLGGINGRELVLETYDSAVLEHSRAAGEACAANLFAMVGSASAQDNQGAQQIVDCGLVDVPTFTATPDHADADNMVQPIPNPTYEYNSGPCRYIAEEYPEAVESAAVTYVEFPVTQIIADRFQEACGDVLSFESSQGTSPVGQNNWEALLASIEDEGAGYYTHWGEKEDLAQALTTMDQQEFRPEVIDVGPQFYDPGLLELAGPSADGTLVWLGVVPLEEVDDNPEMQLYFEWLEREFPGAEPTALGVQTWSAGLLFATGVKALGNEVTRQALFEELSGVHEWDGDGLHFPADPGANRAAHCFLYMVVEDGEFTRSYPDEGFDCDESYRVELTGDYGQGATSSG